MKPEELMIGDYFTLIDFNGPTRITAIYDDVVQLQENYKSEFDEEWYSEAYIKDLKPIPLTSEIFEKNGFRLQSDRSELGTLDTYWLGNELGAFRIHRLNNGDYQFGLAKIKFVHQLQHALRLCGIDKEIKV